MIAARLLDCHYDHKKKGSHLLDRVLIDFGQARP